MIDQGSSRHPWWPPELHCSSALDQAAGPLRGRGPEVEILGDVLDRVAARRPALVVIEGEAGIGKTRLMKGAREDTRARGMRVARGRAEELEQSRPFGLAAAAFGCVLR